MKVRIPAIAMFIIMLAGCSATIKRDSADHAAVAIPQSSASKLVLNISGSKDTTSEDDWNAFKQEWVENFTEQAGIANVAFEVQDGPVKPNGENGVLLSVFIEDYRFLRPGTRYAVGVMAGNAFIESKLTFNDLKTGESFGSQVANTSSSAWEGIFSAMTNKQVEAIAVDVFKQMKGGKK
jgi:hypothetical protein